MNLDVRFKICFAVACGIVQKHRAIAPADFDPICGGSSAPSPPDPNVAALAGQQAALADYPEQYDINALAQEGGTGTVGGKTYDFSGLSPAEVSGGVSQQMAQALLQIQQTNDPQVIQQQLQNLQQSDPAGYAAYNQLFGQIMQSAQNPTDPNQPLSGQLQSQIGALVAQGPTLTTGPNSTTENVQNSVRSGQVASGIDLGNEPAFQESAALDTAGQQQQATNEAEANAYNNAGVSPEDVQFRQVQQSLSNLGAFQNGQTPLSEFPSLSGAGTGAAAFTTYGANQAQPNLGAGLQGIQDANAEYAGNVNFANNTVNPFLTGLSSGVQGIGLGNALFGNSSSIPNYGQPSAAQTAAAGAGAYANDPSNADLIDSGTGISGDYNQGIPSFSTPAAPTSLAA